MRAAFDDLVASLLPSSCAGCGRSGAPVCSECVRTFAVAPTLPPPTGVTWWGAAFAYEGVVRELVARAKYRGARHALRALTPALVAVASRAPAAPDVITWPLVSAARRRLYGVDNAALLARDVGRAQRVTVARLLHRARGVPQTGLDRNSRRRGPKLRATMPVEGATVLVVDDVATTGGTLSAAARALRAAGAREVNAVTVARTRPPWDQQAGRAYTAGPHSRVSPVGDSRVSPIWGAHASMRAWT
jgi:predicted amidophosphoribosyltransferase